MSLIGQSITVLGAGIAGLAAARALALRGADVTVLEQTEAIREVGAGLQISPNGAAVLKALGLGAALETAGVAAQSVALNEGLSGDLVLRLDVARRGYWFLHRADLIDLLAAGAREAGVQIRLMHRIEAVELSGSRPRVVTDLGTVFEPELLIGADGINSRVRVALNGTEKPFFTNQVAWRTVIPETAGVLPVAEVFMGPGRHLVSYPLRGGTLRNIVAVEERRRWAQESWSLKDDPMEMRVAFERFAPRARAWLDAAESVHLWGLFRHPVATRWHGRNAAILGDAAHPTLPFLAQGANMALEDAWVLAESLAGHDTVEAGLAAYQAARVGRTRRIVDAASTNARVYHLGTPFREIAHLGLKIGGTVAPGLVLDRFNWIYNHDVTA